MKRNLESLVNIPRLKNGQKVNVRLPEDKQFLAQVVGLGSSGILQFYIVEFLINSWVLGGLVLVLPITVCL